MFGPGGILFLLSHELLLSWRNFRATGKGRTIRRIIFYGVMIALLGFGGYWAARLLSEVRPEPTPLLLGGVSVAFAVLLTLMLSQSLLLITETLYQRGDLDLLLSSPISPWRVIIVRMSAIAINVGLFYLILTGAVFVWLPVFGGWAWMSFAPSVLMLTFFAVALGLVVARLLFATIGPKNTRVAAQVLGSIIGAAFFIATQVPRLFEDESRAQAFQQLYMRLAPVLGDPAAAWSLPARAAVGVGNDFWIWTAIALGAYVVAVWWYAAGFARDAAAISGLGSRKRRKVGGVRAMRGGVNATLVRKEWRLLLRDPLLLSQILLQLLYLAPFFAVFATRLGRDEGITRFDAGGFASGFVILVTSLAASLAWLCVSAEDAPDLIASAPVPRDQMDNAKAFAAAAPAAALLIPPVIGAAIVVSPIAALWLLIGGSAAIISTCLIAIWYQAPGNRKEFRRRTRGSLLLNLGRVLVSFAWIGATGLAVGGLEVFAIIPAFIALGLLLAMHESRPKTLEAKQTGSA